MGAGAEYNAIAEMEDQGTVEDSQSSYNPTLDDETSLVHLPPAPPPPGTLLPRTKFVLVFI